jgi:hypothetical protein
LFEVPIPSLFYVKLNVVNDVFCDRRAEDNRECRGADFVGQPGLVRFASLVASGALEKVETEGFMKVLVDAGTKQILGAAILGTGGDEAIHCILDIIYARAPFTTIQRAVHIHPTGEHHTRKTAPYIHLKNAA